MNYIVRLQDSVEASMLNSFGTIIYEAVLLPIYIIETTNDLAAKLAEQPGVIKVSEERTHGTLCY